MINGIKTKFDSRKVKHSVFSQKKQKTLGQNVFQKSWILNFNQAKNLGKQAKQQFMKRKLPENSKRLHNKQLQLPQLKIQNLKRKVEHFYTFFNQFFGKTELVKIV